MILPRQKILFFKIPRVFSSYILNYTFLAFFLSADAFDVLSENLLFLMFFSIYK
jgi:hypothetical protein